MAILVGQFCPEHVEKIRLKISCFFVEILMFEVDHVFMTYFTPSDLTLVHENQHIFGSKHAINKQ